MMPIDSPGSVPDWLVGFVAGSSCDSTGPGGRVPAGSRLGIGLPSNVNFAQEINWLIGVKVIGLGKLNFESSLKDS